MLIATSGKALTTIHPNIVINIDDRTIIRDDTRNAPDLPRFNMLIPTVLPRGMTNTMEIYYPKEPNRYILAHGEPNPAKYGIGPSLIHYILNSNSGIGVYTINLRGEDATMANMIVAMKYRIDTDVPYTDDEGNPYYLAEDENGNRILTLEIGIDRIPVVRDVMHVKFVTSYVENCKSWTDVHSAMLNMTSDAEDEFGYKTLPWFAVMYKGATSYGNDVYWQMTPRSSEADGNVYYSIQLFDGNQTVKTNSLISFDSNAGARYGEDYYIESGFNNTFQTLRFMTSESKDDIVDLFSKHLYTLDDIINGSDPSIAFSRVDPFAINEFGIQLDDDSLDISRAKAFQLQGGEDGEMDRDKLFEDFFSHKIIPDLKSVLRYRFSYVPDIGYNETTKNLLVKFVEDRSRMTTSSIMLGSYESFISAAMQRRGDYYGDMPNIRILAKCQSPMRFDSWCRKTMRFPASYYDTIALVDHVERHAGVPYYPFAGAYARWKDFLDDTMVYPNETFEEIDELARARVNFVMRDKDDGAYISDQLTNINFESDQLEFNNILIISDMLYDLVDILHKNHFSFNENAEVATLREIVADEINTRYAQYSASLMVDVYREGNVGRAKSTNIVEATVDLKDINRFAKINLILVEN